MAQPTAGNSEADSGALYCRAWGRLPGSAAVQAGAAIYEVTVKLQQFLATLPMAVLAACATAPGPAPVDPSNTAAAFTARRLDQLGPDLPSPSLGWDRAQWLSAALQLNPQLAEARARVAATAAAERTAAQRANPTMNLFAEYVSTAARSAAWLYGLSLDFLLRRPGDRARAMHYAAVQTALANSDLAESIWLVRAALRQALLDVASSRDESALLEALIAERQTLLATDRARARCRRHLAHADTGGRIGIIPGPAAIATRTGTQR